MENQKQARECQLELVDRLTRLIWKPRFLAKQICYYGAEAGAQSSRYDQAVSDYEHEVWSIFTEIKALKSASMVWFPTDASDRPHRATLYLFQGHRRRAH